MDVLQIIILVVAAYLLGTCVFLSLVYLRLALDRDRSPEARPLRAALEEIGWASLTEWSVPLAWLCWPPWWRRATSSAPQTPVLLVHGWGQNRADFWGLAWRLRRRTGRPIFAMNYWFFGPVEQSARRLGRQVERIRRRTGADRVHLVCHSLGGLVARTYVEQQGGAPWVASLTTVGTPHAGTTRARPPIGASTRQLRPGSDFLTRLGPPHPPEGVPYHAAWSHSDGMVLPPRSATLQGAGPELELVTPGHLGLLYNAVVADHLAGWLEDGDKRP